MSTESISQMFILNLHMQYHYIEDAVGDDILD